MQFFIKLVKHYSLQALNIGTQNEKSQVMFFFDIFFDSFLMTFHRFFSFKTWIISSTIRNRNTFFFNSLIAIFLLFLIFRKIFIVIVGIFVLGAFLFALFFSSFFLLWRLSGINIFCIPNSRHWLSPHTLLRHLFLHFPFLSDLLLMSALCWPLNPKIPEQLILLSKAFNFCRDFRMCCFRALCRFVSFWSPTRVLKFCVQFF